MSESSKKTLLLVEDEAILALTGQKQLERYGYSVITAHSGEKAVEAVASHPEIDLVLMDINLGRGIDGTEAAERILKSTEIPIVFLSSHTEPEVVERTEKITSYGYVVKNSSITVLDASIKMAFKLFDAKKKELEKEKALAVSERKYRLISENTSDGIVHFSAEGKIDYISPSYLKQLGYSADEVLDKGFDEIALEIHPEDRDAFALSLRTAVAAKEQELTCSYRVKHKRGHYLWREDHARVLYDASGRYLGTYVSCRDVTARKQIEVELEESKTRAELLLNLVAEIIISLDFDGNILLLNEYGHRILGYEYPELLGRNYFDLCQPAEDHEKVRGYFYSLRDQAPDYLDVHENGVITKTGERRTILWHNSMLKDRDGKSIGLFSSGEDITERKRVEEELKEREERYRFALEASNLGDWDWDYSTGKVRRNRRWAEMLGYTLEELEGTLQDGVELRHPDDIQRIQKDVGDHLTGLTDHYSIEYRMRAKNGGYKWIRDCGKIMERDADGNPLRLCGTHEDIDERKRIRDKIDSLLAEKELMLKEIHHRMKNFMNTVGGLLTLQEDALPDPSARIALQDTANRIRSMSILYDKLYRSGDYRELSMRDYLPALVDEVVSNFPNSKTVRVETDVQDFALDAQRLQPIGIVVNELLTNCMKYAFQEHAKGSIRVSAGTSDGRVSIAVQDDGVGMPESLTLENSTGFGLQLVAALSGQLSGTLRIERGRGTTAVLEFPL